MALLVCVSAQARTWFVADEITCPGSQILACDLDGDGLKDLVLLNNTNLFIFYQDRNTGFPRAPQQTWPLDHQPCLVWHDRLGSSAESLLLMTSDGVNELRFTNRTAPPSVRQIIRQRTIVPQISNQYNAWPFPFTAGTGGDWPLVLAPTADGIQVWQHSEAWRPAQLIGHTVSSRQLPFFPNPGYGNLFDMEFCLNDVNHDGRADLMVKRRQPGPTNIYEPICNKATACSASNRPCVTRIKSIRIPGWIGSTSTVMGKWI